MPDDASSYNQLRMEPAVAATQQDCPSSENRLEPTRHDLAQVIEFLPDPTWVIDAQGRVVFWNHAMENLTGVPKEAMLGKSDFEHSLPFYGYRRPTLIDLVLRRDPAVEATYLRLRERDDRLAVSESFHPLLKPGGVYLQGSAQPLYDDDGSIIGAIESVRDITEQKREEIEKENLIAQLQEALSKVKRLSGLLPICAHCKKIRDGRDYWREIEAYIQENSEADFTHGICPDCKRMYYPKLIAVAVGPGDKKPPSEES